MATGPTNLGTYLNITDGEFHIVKSILCLQPTMASSVSGYETSANFCTQKVNFSKRTTKVLMPDLKTIVT